MVQPGRSGPATAPKAAGKVPAGLFNSRNELAVTSIFGWCLSSISKDDVVHNIQNYLQGFDGGQAQVYRCRWQNLPAQWDGSQSVIEDGTPVAVKIMKLVKPGMKPFEQMTAQHEFLSAGRYLERQLRIEVNILGALHHPYPEGSCGKRVVHPLGIIRWGGEWQEDPVKRAQLYWEPMYGFCLPYYELGSLMALMRTVCHE
ncbi:transketolase [Chlorella sorokiniana]|uniref:Transketolase n=1 Tax=Chlorella sorokiniana TaxID=3076 RepID=A0A2P6TRP0_CHLSO|nr:transketolase [Chlorella sorokiniana]|eukprot:PRW56724.1 transketolase [Chlorella sorokiniana]